MLSEYSGPSNSAEMLQYLVGEEIKGAMMDGAHLVLILESNAALVLTSLGGEYSPAFFAERGRNLERRVRSRKEKLARQQAELEAVTFLDELLPTQD